jgi:hypothetical protein
LNRTSTGHTPYGPLQRRLLGLAGLLSALIIALFVFHALHSGETGLNAVAEAAERTASQPGAKLAIEVKYSFEHDGRSVQVTGTGQGDYDSRTDRSDASLSVPVPGQAALTVESIATKTKVFMRSPSFAGQLPAGKQWMEMEPLLGHSSTTAVGSESGAGNTLAMLKSVGGGAERVGQETVRGHLTTHYKGTVELSRVADLTREGGETELSEEVEALAEKEPAPIPVDVWIDEKGLVRQVEMVQQLPASGSDDITGSMDLRMQFFAFGHRAHIKLPPKREVFDYTPALRAELGMDDGTAYGPLEPPASAKPLSVAAFRRRANQMCLSFEAKAKALERGAGPLKQEFKELGPEDVGTPRMREATSAFGREYLRPALRLVTRMLRELKAIPPPAQFAEGYHRYLVAGAKSIERLTGFTRAIELGEFGSPLIKNSKAENEAAKKEEDSIAKSLGIGACGDNHPASGSNAQFE